MTTPTATIKTRDDARQLINNGQHQHFKIGVFDIDGVLRGKYISKEKLLSALDNGLGFCDVVLGWDSADQLYDNVKYTGWHTGYPDAKINILPDSCRLIPFEEQTLFFLAEFDQAAADICPRNVLKRVVAKANDMGFEPFGALEYEFFLFDETHESLHQKNFRNLKAITPGNFGYSVLRNSVFSEFYRDVLDTCETMNMPLEGLHTETGPGVIEAAIAVDDALAAGDKAALFKTFLKVLAQRRQWLATFMAKWSKDYPGQSGHIHLSLKKPDGSSAFFDEKAPHHMSKTMQHFVAGQVALMPEFLVMVAPTINSYTRLVPGFWAPTAATWGVENRTCALRVIPGTAKSQRVEYRVAGADANPYLGLAGALASGLWGIENKIELTDALAGNAYEQSFPPEQQLPTTLMDAANRFKQSQAAKDYFGDAFVEHYAATREWEEREARKHISDWQLERYFEII
jgi:glutamine synthetase